MYRAKRHRESTDDAVIDLRDLRLAGHEVGLARGLPGAAGRGELHLEYQPIVDSQDGRLNGVEALLRWTHPGRGSSRRPCSFPSLSNRDRSSTWANGC